ncbi:dihydrofolate reductase family protein [Streptomyces sp. DSM 44917]|uniref:Dihydrofolate reductase family protein n=1 Tax=Streptomyces boetiae TaxID=3075541 RepID=A0ABU2LEW9_9ACTN|nr:dihydrofolate reductase family protein [Streptomyces sp. DSM 44917]MDT0310129.1 dihydrofolate reductase family protein [Streptomyces sp. DSM 44917]
MGKVIVGLSVSLDGIAGGNGEEDFWPVHEAVLGWVFPLAGWRRAQGMEGGEDTLDSRIWTGDYARIGAQVVGRTMYDFGAEHWGENPPFHAPVFVHTRRGGERIEKLGGTSYTFVTEGIEAVVKRAREAAGEKDVLVAGGVRTARAALAAGLVDEVQLHVAPVVIGHGLRLLDGIGQVRLRATRAVQGENALHLGYDVLR